MLKSLEQKFKTYINTTSRLKIAGDVFFYLLILLLLIPATRREIMTTVKKVTLMKPSVKETPALAVLNEADYDLRFETYPGDFVSLADYRGEVLFINFWATWCPPCRAEMPSIQRLYEAYSDKVKFLMITSEQTEAVEKYIQSNQYTFPVLYQRSPLSPSFNVTGIPHTYVINRDGEILISKVGAARWDSPEFMEYLDKLL